MITTVSEPVSAPKYELQAPAIVLAVDNSETAVPSSKGKLKTSTPPRIQVAVKEEFKIYDGKDPAALMAQILKMMEAIQSVQQIITKCMADNSKCQQMSADEYLKVIIANGDEIIKKIRDQEEAAERARQASKNSWILGAVIGVFSVLAAVATLGIASPMLLPCIAMAVMMSLPPEDNPIDMGAKAIGDAMGGGTLGAIFGKVIMIAVIVAAIAAGGSGVGAFAQEGAEVGAQQGAKTAVKASLDEGIELAEMGASRGLSQSAAEVGANARSAVSEEMENNTVSSFTKENVAKISRNMMVDMGVQTTMVLNPFTDIFGEIAKATGHKDDGIGILLQVIGVVAMLITSVIALKYGKCDLPTSGMKGASEEAGASISKWSYRIAGLASIASSGFMIAAGKATLDQARLEREEASVQRIYTTLQALMKMLQSSIQQNGKQQQTTMESFQTINGNFADLAAPLKYLAKASEVLA